MLHTRINVHIYVHSYRNLPTRHQMEDGVRARRFKYLEKILYLQRIYACIGSSMYKYQKTRERALKTVSTHKCNINKQQENKH